MKLNFRLLLPVILGLVLGTSHSMTPLAAASSDNFLPLMSSLKRFSGDKAAWSFSGGTLTGSGDSAEARTSRILTVERFGNFVLRFEMRANSRGASVLVRSAVHPIELLGGYKFDLPGQDGRLSYLDFPNFVKMVEARSKGIPYTNAETLFSWGSAAQQGNDEWIAYEVACLGDHLTMRRNGAVVAHYRHLGGPMEGSVGFQIEGSGQSELRNIQVQILGTVKWSSTPPAGDLRDLPADEWTAQDAPFERISEEAWALETEQLLGEAREPQGFRPLFQETAPDQWHESKSFWSVENGVIRGESHNNFLVTKQDYSDFILKTQVRLTPAASNSGIQVRSRLSETGMEGYQIDMAVHDTGTSLVPWWGQIYGEELNRGFLYGIEDPAKRLELVRHDDWNDVVIICKGNHLIVELNGKVTADLVDYYGDKSGKIGFQVHVGPRMKVEFRDVLIRVL